MKAGTTLLEATRLFETNTPYPIVSAKVNNVSEGLNYRLYNNKDVEFLDYRSPSGMRTYVRSLCFILCKAVEDIFPAGRIKLEHPVSKGYYCNLNIGREVTEEDVARIKKRMQEIVEANLPFHRVECHTAEAKTLFESKGMPDKVKLLDTSGRIYTSYYSLDGSVDFYYGNLTPSTGYIRVFDLIKYFDGLLLRVPSRENPGKLENFVRQDKMLEVFRQNLRWMDIVGLSNVGDLNEAVKAGRATDIINVTEALQEKICSKIADTIAQRHGTDRQVKMVLISGPSSSGKTTFSKRLSVQLMANAIKPHPLSMDNFFVDREMTPKDENGEYDFESLHAIDLELFGRCMKELSEGREVDMPTYNFLTGHREFRGEKLRIDNNMVLVIEGIHALNPDLVSVVPEENKFRIYVSALTAISLDDHNWIPTTDNRLLRRIVRDYMTRGYSAKDTISRWQSVRRGEDKWIFPYQENADAMFNSALLYEFAALRKYAEPILEEVPQDCPEYSEAHRLLKFIKYFTPIRDNDIPPTSLLREFLGGSSFKY